MKTPSALTLPASGTDRVAPLILLVARTRPSAGKERDFPEFRKVEDVVPEDGCLLPRLQVDASQLEAHRLQDTLIVVDILRDPRRDLRRDAQVARTDGTLSAAPQTDHGDDAIADKGSNSSARDQQHEPRSDASHWCNATGRQSQNLLMTSRPASSGTSNFELTTLATFGQ